MSEPRSTPTTTDHPGHRGQPGHTGRGAGRILVAAYAVLAIGSTSRAAVQITTQWSEAPIAFGLSAFSALVYCVATVALARGGSLARRVATVAVTIELVGVLVVGTFSLLAPQDFPRSTVWSWYGAGYLLLPLILPVLGLNWLRRTASRPGAAESPAAP